VPDIAQALQSLQQEVIACQRCPRLRAYCARVAAARRRAWRDWEYWGRPVPSFGDPHARLLIIGLAPGAHGSNRTGRMFTGDPSGDFLFRVLHATGFASQLNSRFRDDGLTLKDAYITAALRCAPPGNKPRPQEIRNCRPFLERELDLFDSVRAVITLGRLAFDVYLTVLRDRRLIPSRSAFPFVHNQLHHTGPGQPVLVSSYHPSQQNTSTGRLTEKMLRQVFLKARPHCALE